MGAGWNCTQAGFSVRQGKMYISHFHSAKILKKFKNAGNKTHSRVMLPVGSLLFVFHFHPQFVQAVRRADVSAV